MYALVANYAVQRFRVLSRLSRRILSKRIFFSIVLVKIYEMSSYTSNSTKTMHDDSASYFDLSWNSVFNLIIDAIVQLGLAITMGYIADRIIAKIHLLIQPLISKYRRRRALNGPDRERWMQELVVFLNQRPQAEVDRFFEVMFQWLEMPQEEQDAYLRRELPRVLARIFGMEEQRPRSRTRGF